MDAVQHRRIGGATDGTVDVTGRCARSPVTCLDAIILIGTGAVTVTLMGRPDATTPASHLASDPLDAIWSPGLGARLKDRSHWRLRTHRPAAESPAPVVSLCSVAESFVTGPIRRRNIAKMATLGWKGPTVFWPRRQRSITALVRKEPQ